MSPELPDWVEENRLAIGLIVAAVIVSAVLVIGMNGPQATDGPTDANDTGDQDQSPSETGDNFTQYPDADDEKVQSGSQGAEVQASINISSWAASPSSVSIDIGNAVRFNNQVDHAVLINWRDTEMDNVTIEAGSSYTARFRGFEYFTIYSAVDDVEGGWPLKGRIDAAS